MESLGFCHPLLGRKSHPGALAAFFLPEILAERNRSSRRHDTTSAPVWKLSALVAAPSARQSATSGGFARRSPTACAESVATWEAERSEGIRLAVEPASERAARRSRSEIPEQVKPRVKAGPPPAPP